MKYRLFVAVLALSSFAVAQRRGGPIAVGGGLGSNVGVGNDGANTALGAGAGASAGSLGSVHTGADTSTHVSAANASGRASQEILMQNTRLSSNLNNLLPQDTTAQQACDGFRNLGQCMAAIHVSHNLGIPFADLKSKTTGHSSVSLGKAIHSIKPDVDAKAEAKKANRQAEADLDLSAS